MHELGILTLALRNAFAGWLYDLSRRFGEL
jgi:hypothetical protein